MNWQTGGFLAGAFCLFLFSAFRQGKKEQREGHLSAEELGGFCLWKAVDSWGNYVLYPTALGIWGISRGTLIMIFVSLGINVIYIIVNGATETDWTLMGWFIYLRDSNRFCWPLRYARLLPKKFRRLGICGLAWVRKALRVQLGNWKLSKPLGFIFFSFWQDSFYAINYLYGKAVKLSNPKILALFLFSHVICNVIWAPVAALITITAQTILKLF